mmetsp:Transcript_4413/g.9577  ORF Transcript_4413/g.9577 Transcript_4413/m.9577 type:complete len:241 (-) Transcript_4413:1403-2125(-)
MQQNRTPRESQKAQMASFVAGARGPKRRESLPNTQCPVPGDCGVACRTRRGTARHSVPGSRLVRRRAVGRHRFFVLELLDVVHPVSHRHGGVPRGLHRSHGVPSLGGSQAGGVAVQGIPVGIHAGHAGGVVEVGPAPAAGGLVVRASGAVVAHPRLVVSGEAAGNVLGNDGIVGIIGGAARVAVVALCLPDDLRVTSRVAVAPAVGKVVGTRCLPRHGSGGAGALLVLLVTGVGVGVGRG